MSGMEINMKKHITVRLLCALMALCLLAGSLVACSQKSEIPDGYRQ